jgi:hypothetical protein
MVAIAFRRVPGRRCQLITHSRSITLLGSLMIGAQLVWTISRGNVYCGKQEIITKARDPLMYGVYSSLHVLAMAFLGIFGFRVLR